MADVVKHGSRDDRGPILSDLVGTLVGELLKETLREVCNSQTVSEAGVLGEHVNKAGVRRLADVAQPLKPPIVEDL